jgi:hypothetical protein
MTEHPTKQQLEEYCRRVLAPAAFLPVHRHVATCSVCAEQCSSSEHAARDLAYLREAFLPAADDTPYHLSAIEAVAYAKGTLNEIDAEIAASHLEGCEVCAGEVKRHAVASRPARRFSLPYVTAWQPVRIAAVVLLAAALVLLMVWLLRNRTAERNEQQAGPANLSTPQSSPIVSSTPAPQPTSPAGVTAPDAEFAVVLEDAGSKVTLDKRGELNGLDQLPVNLRQKLAAALRGGAVQEPAVLAQLQAEASTLMGSSSPGLPFRLLGPLGEVVRTQQPTFRWRALEGAQSYKVTVTDAELNEVATSPELNTTEWRITKPLPHGGLYSWQVTALKDGVAITSPTLPAPQAKFKVIERSTLSTLQQAERAYPHSNLALGVLYAEAGMLDLAEQQLRALVKNNPRVPAAQKLLQSVQALRAPRTSGRS